jgi:hypothetical protein
MGQAYGEEADRREHVRVCDYEVFKNEIEEQQSSFQITFVYFNC